MSASWLRLGIAGLAAYVVFLVLSAPAAKLLPYVQPHLPGVRLAGVSGSLWSGQALSASAGAVRLEHLNWHFRPLGLFTGALAFGLDATLSGQPLKARAGFGFVSGPYVSHVTGRLPAADLLYWTGAAKVQVSGDVSFDIDRIEGLGAGVPALAGTATWSHARVLAPLALELGQVQVQTDIDGGITRGKLSADGGALALNGDLSVKPDGNYALSGEVRKKGSVPQAVDKFLTTFGEPANGGYRLEWSDKIKF